MLVKDTQATQNPRLGQCSRARAGRDICIKPSLIQCMTYQSPRKLFFLHICADVFHISGWIFREAFQKMIQLALWMELKENTSVLSLLKLFCQHLFWALSGFASGISALAKGKGIIFCWPYANLPQYGSALTLWRTIFIPASAQPRASGGCSHCRSKAALPGLATEQWCQTQISPALAPLGSQRDLDAGDVSRFEVFLRALPG